jgi:hypothetical protein
VLAVRERDNRSVQTHAGASGLLPRMLSASADGWSSKRNGVAGQFSTAPDPREQDEAGVRWPGFPFSACRKYCRSMRSKTSRSWLFVQLFP